MQLPTDYQTYIAKSRYARFLDDKGRRENWDETVGRYFDYFEQDLDERHGYKVPQMLRSELTDAVLNLHVMPSMRALMTAGEALRRENIAGYNCFAGDEKFITNTGLRAFADACGEVVQVLASDGQWRPAEIEHFGRQKLQRVTFRPTGGRSLVRHSVKVTPDHRWLTKRGEVTDLRIGDCVPSNAVLGHSFVTGAFVRGFGFGDGTLDARGRARVRLCGEKVRHVENFIVAGASVSYPEYLDGDALVLFKKGVHANWKSLPYEHLSDIDYLNSWLEGYLAADGHLDPTQPGISSQDSEAIAFVKKIAPLCGKVVTGSNISTSVTTNYGPRNGMLHRLTLRDAADFYVVAVEELDEADVFCAVEPVTRTFTLAHGILTGNCSYVPIDRPRALAEILYILMCGTGVGFSVERQYAALLPAVPDTFSQTAFDIIVGDSKRGWATAYETLIECLYAGTVPHIDYSEIRPAGERLKVFGGRASGPEPLRRLFDFTIRTFRNAAGRKLNSLELHELATMTGEAVVVGGVRRSALISLSNLSDQRMRDCKSGSWWSDKPHLALANNSVAYTETPDVGAFMDEWTALYRSRSGERGIFNRVGAQHKVMRLGRRDHRFDFGVNPCGEIVLRPRGLCNLSEAVAREGDDLATLKDKVRLAGIIGTWQATQTTFNFVEPDWAKNAEDERLLGVSLTGVYDNALLRGDNGLDRLASDLQHLKTQVIVANRMEAHVIGTNPSVATTTVKPSGTVSQLVNSPSGIHQGHAPYYIRRVTGDNKDPVTQFMIASGIPSEPHAAKPDQMTVFSFPVKLGEKTVTRDQVTALQHLDLVRCYNLNWSEHAVSCTISVKEHEWPAVGGWVYDHFDDVVGLSFLPHFAEDSSYSQLPYETIDAVTYREMLARMPSLDWDGLAQFEGGVDTVTGTREFACVGNTCEIVDAQPSAPG